MTILSSRPAPNATSLEIHLEKAVTAMRTHLLTANDQRNQALEENKTLKEKLDSVCGQLGERNGLVAQLLDGVENDAKAQAMQDARDMYKAKLVQVLNENALLKEQLLKSAPSYYEQLQAEIEELTAECDLLNSRCQEILKEKIALRKELQAEIEELKASLPEALYRELQEVRAERDLLLAADE